MALFGKKKTAEKSAPQPSPADDIQVMGGDADETDLGADDGQVIDFDAIADDLNAVGTDPSMDALLGRSNAPFATTETEVAATPDFDAGNPPNGIMSDDAGNLDDDLDFNSVFDEGSPSVNAAPVVAAMPAEAEENPFGHEIDIEPISEPINQAPIVESNAPLLTHTAPILTSDVVAGGNAPAMKRSLPLLPLLGAAGLLASLGVVGYLVTSKPEEAPAPVIVTAPVAAMPDANPNLRATEMGSANGVAVVPAPGMASGAVNQGIAVDGVPIAPGVVVARAPIGGVAPGGLSPTVPLTPTLQKQLKALWKKGAAAKQAKNYAGARAAWTQMLRLRPNHPGVQEAIDKLPAA